MIGRRRQPMRLLAHGPALVVVLLSPRSSPAVPTPVPLVVRDCGDRLDGERLRALVDLEVRTSGLAAPINAAVVLRCGPGARRFHVGIHGGQAGRLLASVTVVRGRPGHAERELALVIAERLRHEQEQAAAAAAAAAAPSTTPAAMTPAQAGGAATAAKSEAVTRARRPAARPAPTTSAVEPAPEPPPPTIDPPAVEATTPVATDESAASGAADPVPPATPAPVPAPPPSPSPASERRSAGPAPVVADLIPAAPTPRNDKRMRDAGIASLALLGVTVAGFAVGGAILGTGNIEPNNQSLQIAGATTLSIAVIPAAATVVAFGVWLREKLR